MKYIVVTGASTGIGYACCESLIRSGFHVFGSVRKEADAERLRKKFGKKITPLLFDVTKREEVLAAAKEVETIVGNKGLAGLVNNAGVAVTGPLELMDLDQLRWQMEVNVVGLVSTTQAFLPLLGTADHIKSSGRIVNVSSVAGKLVNPFMGPYCASKHAVEAISHAFRRELMLFGIKVVIIAPGPIKTPIWDKTASADVSDFEGTAYEEAGLLFKDMAFKQAEIGLPASDVGNLVKKVLTMNNPKTRYTITPKKLQNWTIPSMLPDKTMDKFVSKVLKIKNTKA